MRRHTRLYVVREASGVLKLGHSVNPSRRARELGDVDVIYQSDVIAESEKVERTAHRLLALAGKRVRAERFNATLSEVLDAVSTAESIVAGVELPLDRRKTHARPATLVRMLVSADELAAIDEIVRERHGMASRTQVLREVLMDGLVSMGKVDSE